jgi:DNA polymerase alpha subunit B
VLVEYAVNDASHARDFDTPALRAFERLLRKLLRLPNSPAVVLLNAYAMLSTPPRGRYWANAEAHFFELATYYSLPLLSLKACCFHLLVEGRPPFSIEGTANNASLQGRAFYHDSIHPDGLTGHRVLAELPMQLLKQTADELRRGQSDGDDADVGGVAGERQTCAQQRARLRCVPSARATRSSEA